MAAHEQTGCAAPPAHVHPAEQTTQDEERLLKAKPAAQLQTGAAVPPAHVQPAAHAAQVEVDGPDAER